MNIYVYGRPFEGTLLFVILSVAEGDAQGIVASNEKPCGGPEKSRGWHYSRKSTENSGKTIKYHNLHMGWGWFRTQEQKKSWVIFLKFWEILKKSPKFTSDFSQNSFFLWFSYTWPNFFFIAKPSPNKCLIIYINRWPWILANFWD